MVKDRGLVLFLYVGISIFPALFFEKVVLYLMHVLSIFVEDHLAVGVWVYLFSKLFHYHAVLIT